MTDHQYCKRSSTEGVQPEFADLDADVVEIVEAVPLEFSGDITKKGTGGIIYDPGSDVNTNVITVNTSTPASIYYAPSANFWITNASWNISSAAMGAGFRWFNLHDGTNSIDIWSKDGSPEGDIEASKGSISFDTATGDLYIKTTDTVNTGWIELLKVADKYTDAEAIAAIENEATLTFQQPTTISTKSGGGGVLTLESEGNSLHLKAAIDIRIRKDVLFYDNLKFWIGSSKDYWFEYSTSGSRLLFKSRDIDGSMTEGVIFRVLDGTQILEIIGGIKINGDLNHDGSKVGFYETEPIVQQTGVPATAAGIHAALVNLGLITT